MADIVPLHKPDDYKRVMIRIKTLWREGSFRILNHAAERMQERNKDTTDIENCIRYGRIIEHRKPDVNWRYTIIGRAVDGESMKIAVEINGKLIIVTVI